MKREMKDSIVLGAALFAMFFGAGNLIFPPAIGVASGESWFLSMLGFFFTGICLPVMGVLAVSKAGGTISEFASKVSHKFSLAFGTIVILAIGPLLAIPRTGATVYEIGIKPLGEINPLLVSIIYFGITLLFVIKPNGIIDKVGKILTPILLFVIGTIIITGLIHPIGIPVASKIENAFTFGFLEGYQTMDTLGAIVMGGIILAALLEKGYTDTKKQMKMTTTAGLISGSILMLIYGGLLFLGASISGNVEPGISKTALILDITKSVLGNNGLFVISIAVSAACLTTSIGLTAIVGNYFEKISKGKLSYKLTVIVVCAFSALMSVVGVETIVEIAVPLLVWVYPVAMVLIVFNIIEAILPHKFAFTGGVLGAGFIGFMDALKALPFKGISESLKPIYDLISKLPFANVGFAWVLPAVLLALAFGYYGKYFKNYRVLETVSAE